MTKSRRRVKLPRLLTTAEVAEILEVTQPRVLQLIKAEILPATMLGNRWFVLEADVGLARKRRKPGWPKGKPRPAQRRRPK